MHNREKLTFFVQTVKDSMDTAIEDVERKLKKQADIRQKKVDLRITLVEDIHVTFLNLGLIIELIAVVILYKATLHRLRSIIDSVEKMEKLLGIQPNDTTADYTR